jgi:hypothetical protein
VWSWPNLSALSMESSFESRVRARLTRIGGALVAAGKRENGRDRNNLRPRGWSDVRNIAFNPVGKRVVTADSAASPCESLARMTAFGTTLPKSVGQRMSALPG